MAFKDYFSEVSQNYQIYRPDYPEALFDYLSKQCAEHQLAWDCATGNGQAAKALTKYFDQIIATDGSQAQIDATTADPKIQYLCEPAEQTTLKDHSVDLITVAQAAHWFDLEKFYAEVKRVLKPQGALALWCYQNVVPQNEAIHTLTENLYWKITRPYWAEGRDYIDDGYQTLSFPFHALPTPTFFIQKFWTCDQLLGYLSTWSGLRAFLKADSAHAKQLEELFTTVKDVWPKTHDMIEMCFPIILKIARPLE